MRILHIIPSFASGGAEHVVVNYIIDWEQFTEDEMMALSLYKKTGSINDQIIIDKDLNVKYADCKYNNKIEMIKAIQNATNEFKPDVIHSHMRILPYVYLATLGRKIRIVHTIHTEPEVNSSGRIFYFDRFCFRRLRVHPICLNKEMANRANKLYRIEKTEHLYNGIRLSEYSGLSEDNKKQLRNSLGINEDETVIGHVGRFVPIKNHQLIVEVFSEYVKKHQNSKLLLIGEGPEFNNIKVLAEQKNLADKVVFTGVRSDVPQLLQIMDKYIFPSKVEGLGISVIEAQAAGLPCVISNIIPVESVVSDSVTRVNLDDGIDVWVNALEGNIPCIEKTMDLKCYSNTVINNNLRNIYAKYCKGGKA